MFRKIFDLVLDLFFPHRCFVCDQSSKNWLCIHCSQTLVFTHCCQSCLCDLEEDQAYCPICVKSLVKKRLKQVSLFEEHRTVSVLVDKICHASYYPIVKVLASYVFIKKERVKWPAFSKVVTFEKPLKPLVVELSRNTNFLQKKNSATLVLVSRFPVTVAIERKIHMHYRKKDLYILGVTKDYDSR